MVKQDQSFVRFAQELAVGLGEGWSVTARGIGMSLTDGEVHLNVYPGATNMSRAYVYAIFPTVSRPTFPAPSMKRIDASLEVSDPVERNVTLVRERVIAPYLRALPEWLKVPVLQFGGSLAAIFTRGAYSRRVIQNRVQPSQEMILNARHGFDTTGSLRFIQGCIHVLAGGGTVATLSTCGAVLTIAVGDRSWKFPDCGDTYRTVQWNEGVDFVELSSLVLTGSSPTHLESGEWLAGFLRAGSALQLVHRNLKA